MLPQFNLNNAILVLFQAHEKVAWRKEGCRVGSCESAIRGPT